MIKHLIFLLAFAAGSSISLANSPKNVAPSTFERVQIFVKNNLDFAKMERDQFGIPVSITLAQAILESRFGESHMAKSGNNLFGIKCHDWKGDTLMIMDDEKGESCFRVYKNVAESFHDHSVFLQQKRYQNLLKLNKTDYESWAFGLKAAGYATDSLYAEKLIHIIVQYDLAQYDLPNAFAFETEHLPIPPPPAPMRQRFLFTEMRPEFAAFVLR
jgi:flagellum-specific peptidoglycan hydrolase FlgJ